MFSKKSVPKVVLQYRTKWDIFVIIKYVYYCYILQLNNKEFYHGYSNNLKERLKDHKQGLVSSTKNLQPIKLIFYAAFSSKMKALEFEQYLKTNSGFAFRNKRLIDK